jgi:hypothetical protein
MTLRGLLDEAEVPATGGVEPPQDDQRSSVLTGSEVDAFQKDRDDFAPRSAALLRGLLDATGIPATGGREPPPLAPTLF